VYDEFKATYFRFVSKGVYSEFSDEERLLGMTEYLRIRKGGENG